MFRRVVSALAILVLLTAMFPASALAAGPQVPAPPFWDVIGTPYQDAVGRLYGLGLVAGTSENQFSPRQPVTRAQMAAFVVRALKAEDAGAIAPLNFRDLPASHWAYAVVLRAAALGIVRGDANGFFQPDQQVTQAEAVAMLVRMLGYEGSVQGGWPAGYVLKANEIKLLQGLPDFALAEAATRAQVAVLLDNAVFRVPMSNAELTLSQAIHRKPVSLAITPAGSALAAGTTRLQATGQDYVGRPIQVPGVTWRVMAGPAEITPDGQLLVKGNQPVTVQAVAAGLSAIHTYDVLNELKATAPRGVVKPGESIQLTATGVTTGGQSIDVTPAWQVKSGPGTVTESGLLTVTGTGTVTVVATVGQLQSNVTVTGATGLTINPAGATVSAGETVRFEAAAGAGAGVGVEWSVLSGTGTISADGVFTAGTTNAVVQAKAGDITSTVGVQVVNRIEISPTSAAVGQGQSQQFTAVAKSGDGTVVPATVSWSVSPASLGIIDRDGRFVATGSGSGTVTATFRTVKGTASLAAAGTASAVKFSADRTTIVANGKSTLTISAAVTDANGNTVTNQTGSIFFTLDSATLGGLDKYQASLQSGVATATFTSSTSAGTVRVYASLPGSTITGSYIDLTTTAPAISKVELRAFPTTIAAASGSKSTISVTLVDQDGQPLTNTTGSAVSVTLNKVGGGTLSSTSVSIGGGVAAVDVTFTADGSEGSTTISGAAIYSVVPVTLHSVPVGAAHQLAIQMPTTTAANGSASMTVKVAIQDDKGATRTQDNNILVTLSARVGTTTPAGFPKQALTSGGVATFTITTTVAGNWQFSATGGGLIAGTATGEFTAGTASKLELAAVPALGTTTTSYISADGGKSVIKLRARVLDSNNNLVTSAAHAVTFSKTTNNSVTQLPDTRTVSAVGGVAEIDLTSTGVVGSDIFSASAAGLISATGFTVTSRITGTPVKAQVQPITNALVGDPVTVKVWLQDPANNVVTGANDIPVRLYSTSATTDLGGVQLSSGGVATFTIKEPAAGGITITATAEGLTADTTGKTVTFTAAPADHIKLTAIPDVIPADGTSQSLVTASVVDAYGNPASGGSTSISLTSAGPGSLLATSISTSGSFTVRAGTTPGTITVQGTAGNGLLVQPVKIVTSIPGTPDRVVVEETAPITAGNAGPNQLIVRVKILDTNGNVAANLNSGADLSYIGVTLSGMSSATTTTVANQGSTGLSDKGFVPDGKSRAGASVRNGVATFTYTNTKAETVTVTPVVYYQGQLLTAVPGTITTKPGPATKLTIDPAAPVLSTAVASTRNLTAKVTDTHGNAVAQSGETIRFSLNRTTYVALPATTTVAADQGSAGITLTSVAQSTGGVTTLTATSTLTGLSATATVTTDQPPAKPNIIVTSTGGGTTVNAGQHVMVQLNVSARNAAQNVLVYVNGILVNLRTTAGGSTNLSTVAAGSTGATGYINYADLGGAGVKSVSIILTTDLGTSPVSDTATLTVQ